MSFPQRLEEEFGEIRISAHATGRKDDRGLLVVRVEDDDGAARSYISPEMARAMGRSLIEMAKAAEQFSTRGFADSDE